MKIAKPFLVLLLAVLMALPAMAEYTPEQKAFRNSVMTYLREEGYAPKIDEDGDLAFKKEGSSYYIRFMDGGDISYYVEFHGPGLSLTDANKAVALMACNHVNLNKKCAKAMITSDHKSITFTVELFCESASDFNAVFNRCLNALDSSYEAVKEYYSEHDSN